MSVFPDRVFSAVAKVPRAETKRQLWPSFFKSLVIPILLLAFFAAAPHWLNAKLRSGVIKKIESNDQYSETEKARRIAIINQTDYAAICRDQPPEYAKLYAGLVKAGIADTFKYLRWGLALSIALVGLLLAASFAFLALNVAARRSPESLIRCYRAGWYLGVASALLQVLLLVPLLAYSVYELPVLVSDHWYPKLVIVVLFLGVAALWRSINLLLKSVPLQFNEPLSRRVTPEESPELWQAVRFAAARLQTSPPDNIIIGMQLNFYVTELSVSNGSEVAHGRTLFLSYPMLKQLSQDEVLAIIGHELGHFIGEDTRLTRQFYPMRFKVRGTMVTLAQATWLGWTSLQFLNFFSWCFGETERATSRQRELLADEKAAALTSRETAARALVRFHALIEAFQHGLIDSVNKGAQSPLDVPLYTVVREKLPAGSPFWTELFEQKLPHPLDSHPALRVRLESLGQSMDAAAAETLASQETVSAYSVWFAGRDAIFSDVRQQADAILQKMRSTAQIRQADYQTAEGRALLDQHFPENKWAYRNTGGVVFGSFVVLLAAVAWLLAFAAVKDNPGLKILFFLVGLFLAALAAIIFLRHKRAELILKADSICHTGWKHPLRFQDVTRVIARKSYSTVILVFLLKERQWPIQKYSFVLFPRKTIGVSLSGLKGVKQADVAKEVFRYFTRQISG